MRVVACNYNTDTAGWSCFEDKRCVDSGVIDLHEVKDIEKRLSQMSFMICKQIEEADPEYVVIEDIQTHFDMAVTILLLRLKEAVLGYCYACNIKVEMLTPLQWHAVLDYEEGQENQSKSFVKEYFGFDRFSDERCEAVAMGVAAHKIYGFAED